MLLIGSIAFVGLGTFFIINHQDIAEHQSLTPVFVQVLGWVAAVFFGICGLSIIRKLLDRSVGLRIDDQGIMDNTSSSAAGLVEWQDIERIERITIASNKMIMIHVVDPEKYIARGKNRMIRQAMKMNTKLYGTPITIISSSLKIKYKDLEKLILEQWDKRS